MKSIFKKILKLLLVFGLLAYLAKKEFISVEATARALSAWEYIVPAYICFALTGILSIYRWHLLLRSQGIEIPLLRATELSLVGFFFNVALPGAVSGDVMKAVYMGKELPGKRAAAFGSILFDRILGVSALVLVSAGGMVLSFSEEWGGKLFDAISLVILASAGGVIFFYAYLFLVKDHFDPVLAIFKKAELKFPFVTHLTRTYESVKIYQSHAIAVLVSLLISLVIHLLAVAGFILLTLAIGESWISNLATTVLAPLGLLVSAIPVLPAGIGTGHAAFSWLFFQIGSKRGADLFTLYVLYKFLEGSVGGLIYLRFKSGMKLPSALDHGKENSTSLSSIGTTAFKES